MTEKEYNNVMDALMKQREEVSQSREAARKLLVDLGIYHLFVPKGSKSKKRLSGSK